MNFQTSALLVIDMQYDFMPGGSLAVANANDLIHPINNLMTLGWCLVIASQDWHPQNHISFASNNPGNNMFDEILLADGSKQVLWPTHCVQNGKGAAIHHSINQQLIHEIILKGQNPNVDSYSAFFDNNHQQKTALDNTLKVAGITDIYVTGLAADYCVKFTALDGQQLGYNVYFIANATKAVNPNAYDALLKELKSANVNIIYSEDIK